MEKLAKFVGQAILALAMIGVVALLSGTIIWIVWPAAASIFPAAIQAGWILPRIAWWQAVALSWIVTALIKSQRPTVETKGGNS